MASVYNPAFFEKKSRQEMQHFFILYVAIGAFIAWQFRNCAPVKDRSIAKSS
jgi:hypothetical protein